MSLIGNFAIISYIIFVITVEYEEEADKLTEKESMIGDNLTDLMAAIGICNYFFATNTVILNVRSGMKEPAGFVKLFQYCTGIALITYLIFSKMLDCSDMEKLSQIYHDKDWAKGFVACIFVERLCSSMINMTVVTDIIERG